MELKFKTINDIDGEVFVLNIDNNGDVLITKDELFKMATNNIFVKNKEVKIRNALNNLNHFINYSESGVFQHAIETSVDSLIFDKENKFFRSTLGIIFWLSLIMLIVSLIFNFLSSWWILGSLLLSKIILIWLTSKDPLVTNEAINEEQLNDLHERQTNFFTLSSVLKSAILIYIKRMES